MSTQKALFDQAFAHLRAGKPEEAISLCSQGLEQQPGDANLMCLWARALIVLKQFDQARIKIMAALKIAPEFATAHELMGDLLLIEGQAEKALAAYQHTQNLKPEHKPIEPKIKRAQDLLKAQTQDAAPDLSFTKELEQAEQLKKDGKPAQAEEIYRTILRRNPNHVEAMRQLAAIAVKHKKYGDAEMLLQRAVSKSTDFALGWLALSHVQLDMGKYPEALNSAERLLELTPDKADSHVVLGNTQAQTSQPEQAVISFQKALELAPKHKGAFSGLAHQLKTIGRQQESIAVHRQCIEVHPDNTDAYWNLANMKTFRFEDSEVAAMEALLQDDKLEDLSVVQLCNALGLEYESRKEYQRAFQYFQRCNETHRPLENYDPVGHEVMIEKIMEVFNPDFIDQNQGRGNPDISPIFVVGLPRSGSTLIEQILASHSQVEGTHELPDLAHMVQDFKKNHSTNMHFPENLREPGQKSWVDMGSEFIQRTQKYRSGTPRFIDKNPNNFIYTGLLHLMLPNAKIINA